MTARFPKGSDLDSKQKREARRRAENSRRATRLRRSAKRARRLIKRDMQEG